MPEHPGEPGLPGMSDAGGGISFTTRKWVRPEDLNAHGTLFGGSLLRWIDEEAAIFAVVQMGNDRIVTKFVSEIDFESSAKQGDLIEIEASAVRFGRTSLTVRVEVRNMISRKLILTVEKVVFVNLDEQGRPAPHGFEQATPGRERLPRE